MSQPQYSVLDIDSPSTDSNGQSYYAGNAEGGHFFDLTSTGFYSPDSTYTGYAANGYYYTNGVINSSKIASWSLEGDDSVNTSRDPSTRSNKDRFPDRVFIFYSKSEVTILDADSLTIWMKINVFATPSFANARVIKAKFIAGVLCIIAQQQDQDGTPGILLTYSFKRDCIVFTNSTNHRLREFIWNRHDATAYGSLTDTAASYPFTTTGTSIDHNITGTGTAFPAGQLYDLDMNYVGNNLRALIGGLGFFVGFNPEAHTETVGSKEYKAPLFKQHSQTRSYTIASFNVNISDIQQLVSGITATWSFSDPSPGNDLATDGVNQQDILKITGQSGSNVSYFTVFKELSQGQQNFVIQQNTTFSDKDRQDGKPSIQGLAFNVAGWKNAGQPYLDVQNDLEAQNTYEVLKAVSLVRILSNGDYIVLSGAKELYYLSDSSIIDHTDITQTSFFNTRGSLIPRFTSYIEMELVGLAANLEQVYLVSRRHGILNISIDDLKLTKPLSYLASLTDIKASSSEASSIGNLYGITIDPSSGNLFVGALKNTFYGDTFYIECNALGEVESVETLYIRHIDSDGDGVLDTPSPPLDAERPIIMDGYQNPSGPPEV